jgi:hypothetical protein
MPACDAGLPAMRDMGAGQEAACLAATRVAVPA